MDSFTYFYLGGSASLLTVCMNINYDKVNCWIVFNRF